MVLWLWKLCNIANDMLLSDQLLFMADGDHINIYAALLGNNFAYKSLINRFQNNVQQFHTATLWEL